MKHSEQISDLAGAMVDASKEMPVIGFDATNPFLKNKYASLGAVIAATRPVLAKHGLVMLQMPVSQNGTMKRVGQENAGTEREPKFETVTNERAGTVDIGIETTLLHKSGQWLSGEIFVQVTKEKGKSVAQVSGSIISYLRRYAWSSVLGLYADEDTDGNEPATSGRRSAPEDSGRFEDLPQDKPKTGGGQSTPRTAAATPASPAPAAPAPANVGPAVTALRTKLGPLEGEFVRCLQFRPVNDQGQVVLVSPAGLNQLTEGWAKHYLNNWDTEIAAIETWCQSNPAETKPIEVPRDANPDPNSPDAPWRKFQMPWGEKQGIALEQLDKKYLFGLWANYKVETTYKGQPKKPETVAADTKFRQMLDEAGKHYEFYTR